MEEATLEKPSEASGQVAEAAEASGQVAEAAAASGSAASAAKASGQAFSAVRGQIGETVDCVEGLAKTLEELRAANDNEAKETLTRLYELLESQRLAQQALLSKLTGQADALKKKEQILEALSKQDMKALRPLLADTDVASLVSMRDEQGFTLCHMLCRLGLGPALEFLLKRAPMLADQTSSVTARAGNWTPLMILSDAPPASLGGEDYQYNMVALVLRYMSATGLQFLVFCSEVINLCAAGSVELAFVVWHLIFGDAALVFGLCKPFKPFINNNMNNMFMCLVS